MAGQGGSWQEPYFDGTLDENVTDVKASGGYVHSLEVRNADAAIRFLQLFNVPAASVTLGTTAPTQSYSIPASGSMDKFFDNPMKFKSGISYALTTTDTGNTAPTTAGTLNVGYR